MFIVVPPLLLLALFGSAMAPNATIYAACLVVKGLCVAGIYQSAFVIGIEFLGGRWRFWLANVHSIIFAVGAMYVCLIANSIRAWRILEISLTFPVMLMLSYPW